MGRMADPPLAPVYVDSEPVMLMGDPRPAVAKAVAASGRNPARVRVRLQDREEGTAIPLELEDVLDRTEVPTRPIYLTTVEGDPDLDAPELAAKAARIGSGSGGASQFSVGGGAGPGPGVSGQGNAAGSLQSAYSRTGTDTAGPGMLPQEGEAGFGSGAGKGTSSGAPQSGKTAPAPSRMAAGLEDPFGKEGLAGKADGTAPAPPEPSGLGASRPVRATAPSGTASDAKEDEGGEREPAPEAGTQENGDRS
jgi:hypothetical protein